MSRTRSLLSLVGILAVALSPAGCSLLAPMNGVAKPASGGTPTQGQCWNATTGQAAAWPDWKGTAVIPCARPHTLYTYHVGAIAGENGTSWAAPGDANSLNVRVQTKAQDACKLTILLPHLKWNQQLINGYFFVPTEAQWRAGARWVRCDVGVLATGTTLDNERFASLPSTIATLVSAVSSEPLRYGLCMNSSTPVTESGPLDNPDATLADCRHNPQWRLSTHGKFPDAAGAPYPADATSNAVSAKLCQPAASAAGGVWFAYLPTKSGWASGDRGIDCWIGQKATGGSAGTA